MSASGSFGVPGTMRTRGSRCAWFASTASRWSTAQPVIPSPNENDSLMTSSAHSPAGEHGAQLAIGLVGLVDVDVLVGDQLGEGVRDALEQGVEALLGEHVVEDLGQASVRLCRAARHEADLRPGCRIDGCRVGHAASNLIGRRGTRLESTSAKIPRPWSASTHGTRCSIG